MNRCRYFVDITHCLFTTLSVLYAPLGSMAPNAIIGLEQSSRGDNHERKSFAVTSGSQIIFCQNILMSTYLSLCKRFGTQPKVNM